MNNCCCRNSSTFHLAARVKIICAVVYRLTAFPANLVIRLTGPPYIRMTISPADRSISPLRGERSGCQAAGPPFCPPPTAGRSVQDTHREQLLVGEASPIPRTAGDPTRDPRPVQPPCSIEQSSLGRAGLSLHQIAPHYPIWRIVSHADAAGGCYSAGSAKSRVPNGGTGMTCSPLHPPIRTAARSRAPSSATLPCAPADVAQRMTTGSDVGQSTAVLRRDRTAELCTPLAWFRTECTSSSTGMCVPCRSYCCSWVRPCCCFWAGLIGKTGANRQYNQGLAAGMEFGRRNTLPPMPPAAPPRW